MALPLRLLAGLVGWTAEKGHLFSKLDFLGDPSLTQPNFSYLTSFALASPAFGLDLSPLEATPRDLALLIHRNAVTPA